jgi:hypothetical protein
MIIPEAMIFMDISPVTIFKKWGSKASRKVNPVVFYSFYRAIEIEFKTITSKENIW